MNVRDNIWRILFVALLVLPPLILGVQVLRSFVINGVLPSIHDRGVGSTIDTTMQVGLFLLVPAALVWMTLSAFRVSKGWGLGILLSIGLAQLAFVPLHWDDAKRPFTLQLIGIAYFIGGLGFLPIHT